ncbi:hypothetical protein DW172_16590 [Agathobacter rectalis]|uniref:SH3b domain-containing protein n=3 Tax=Agathobacter rectalis TaxID=39491 RepID=A0A414ZH30_9FIRM|nr:InlB B-repeat-containing protein [Agathobacter rectalis]RHI16161.1 hypothetical protein DW172_16590 [Agathobacter rectalis]
MKKKFKKLVVCCIVMCLMVTLTPSIKAYAITRNDVSQKLESLMKQYVGRTGTWSYAGGSQCYGFAHMIFDNVFNRGSKQVGNGALSSNPTNYKLNNVASDIKTIGTLGPGYSAGQLENLLEKAAPGDYIQVRRNSSGNPHSMICVNVDGSANTIEIFDANSDGRGTVKHYTQSFSTFKSKNAGVSVYRYYDYYPDIPVHNCDDHKGTERWKVSVSSVLNIRSGPSTSNSIVGTLSNGTEIYICEKIDNGGYTWGKLSSGQGWVALSGNAEYMCGTIPPSYHIQMETWFSDTPMGNEIKECNTQDDVYLCYKIFDKNSGKYLDQLMSSNYSVKETIYNPDGTEAFSYTYNNDNNWIKIGNARTGGTYKGKVEVTGDWNGNSERTVNFIERKDQIEDGVSLNDAFSSQVDSVEKNQKVIYWYKMFDANSNLAFNQYRNREYTVKQEVYSPSGEKIKEKSYNKEDSGSLEFTASSIGKYKCKTTITINGKDIALEKTLDVHDIYTIEYDANGGQNAPESEQKHYGKDILISSNKPDKSYIVYYNPNGGTISRRGQYFSCSFLSWNTDKYGSGITYFAGDTYSKNDSVVLYAQYENPKFQGSPTIYRDGYTFEGWYTEKDGGTKVKEGDVLTGSQALWAHWKQNLSISVSADKNKVNVGQKVTVSGTATGGTAPYTYSYLLHNKDTDSWSRLTPQFVKESSYIWTAGSTGNREFFVEVKDSTGKVVRSSAVAVSTEKNLAVSAKADKSRVNVGQKVVVSGTATGGTAPYTYSYLVHNKDTYSWSRLTPQFVKESSYTWTAGSTGNREFFVEVKDSTGKVVRSSAVAVSTVKEENLAISAKADKSKLNVGQKVVVSGTATGGTAPYTYSYLVHNKDTDSWSRLTSQFVKESSYTWTAGSTGNREFFVEVKDNTGKVTRSTAILVVTK